MHVRIFITENSYYGKLKVGAKKWVSGNEESNEEIVQCSQKVKKWR
jgi:hypothetical protein